MRLIIDTDAGIDDAEAILMALAQPDVTVEAITTVTGNVHIDKVNRNVALLLQMTGRQVPVYAGAALPLIEAWAEQDHSYHLVDGLGDWEDRPDCEPVLEAEIAANALVRLVNENPGELTLVALGPLTNVALAVRLDPTLPQKLKRFVFMGGTVHGVGNTPTVTAEYNIYCDPEAAHIVLEAFPMATMLSWEATLANTLSWEQYDSLSKLDSPLARLHKGITAKVAARARKVTAWRGYLLPDPLAMAATLQPELVLQVEERHVVVELRGQHTRGQTVPNYTRYPKGQSNVTIIQQMDMAGVFELYLKMLR